MSFNPLVVTFIAEWYLLHRCTMVCSSVQVGLFLKVSWALGFWVQLVGSGATKIEFIFQLSHSRCGLGLHFRVY